MDPSQDTLKDFLTTHDAAIDRLREVALHQFEQGRMGLPIILEELQSMQDSADKSGLEALVGCLNDIKILLQSWIEKPELVPQLPDISNLWADMICELSNFFVFMADDDSQVLRQRVSYRIDQMLKALARLNPPLATPTDSGNDNSWGLFESESSPNHQPAEVSKPIVQTNASKTPIESLLDDDDTLASHYLICLLGTQQYALPIHQVREILEQQQEKALPMNRPGIVGLVTVRGLVCPVVDVSHILHSKDDDDTGTPKKRCMVVCEVDRRTFCFNVDDVKHVAAVEEFDDPITALHRESSLKQAISHISHFQSKSVLFVKMREVLPA